MGPYGQYGPTKHQILTSDKNGQIHVATSSENFRFIANIFPGRPTSHHTNRHVFHVSLANCNTNRHDPKQPPRSNTAPSVNSTLTSPDQCHRPPLKATDTPSYSSKQKPPMTLVIPMTMLELATLLHSASKRRATGSSPSTNSSHSQDLHDAYTPTMPKNSSLH